MEPNSASRDSGYQEASTTNKARYYVVERIVGFRPDTNEYNVKWKSFSDKANTWEPFENLYRVTNLIAEFRMRNRLPPLTERFDVPVGAADTTVQVNEKNWPLLESVYKAICTEKKKHRVTLNIELGRPKPTEIDTMWVFAIGCHAYGGFYINATKILYLFDGANTSHLIQDTLGLKCRMMSLSYNYSIKVDCCASSLVTACTELMKEYNKSGSVPTVIHPSPGTRKFYEKRFHKFKSQTIDFIPVHQLPRGRYFCQKCNKYKPQKGFSVHQLHCTVLDSKDSPS